MRRILKISVPKEIAPGENRVALVPETVKQLVAAGLEISVETTAGNAASFTDQMYEAAGASIATDNQSVMSGANVVLKVQPPQINSTQGYHEADMIPQGSSLIGLLQPLTNLDLIVRFSTKNITTFSLDTIPRIARAQSMDALSSQSSIAGYKAALIAANTIGKYFPMMMTAAGTYPPAKGLVLGAGVAGLQAIATARRLGAVMQAFDVRPSVKQEVESLGATFVGVTPQDVEVETSGGYAQELAEEKQKQDQDIIHKYTSEADFVITTAMIPGRLAPTLITEEMVRDMKPGAIIVDLASETGGNCAITHPGHEIQKYGVIINGSLNLPSTMPIHASQTYSRNISSLLLHLIKDGEWNLDFDDAITSGCCITHQGEIIHELTKSLVESSK